MNNLVIMKDKQAVTSSLQIAEVFEKEHKNVLRDISTLDLDRLNFEQMFLEGTEPDSYGRNRKVIYMNRDGFTLLAMGFTGKKALEFKLKYIEAFNQMEAQIKIDTKNLSPELQMFKGLFDSLAKQELATNQLGKKVDNISEIVALNTTDWRKDCRTLISKIAQSQGGYSAYKEIQSAVYTELERRGKVNLKTRQTNKRRRMADEGASKSKRDQLSKLDVINDDNKLIEIYTAIVKEFAIKYGVWNEV
ncbi:Rha family transcriptional regulator [Latilactobacillus sakei]|uniref:Rha family transcriptional regulator n=1 Tax=Latilactobacillus sakei TaxID=1599 RepID=UPI000DC64817|nr:Rha family transcriptional regulator [Latilactobacillus sakei]SPS04288.1 Phage regulatory protein Rha (Phage_pRha) [Latilactobacillus sakei]